MKRATSNEQRATKSFTVGVIGCGNMGSALVRGMLQAGLIHPRRVVTWHPDARRRRQVGRQLRIRIARSNAEVAALANILILAVKPAQMGSVLEEISSSVAHRPLILSVAAGVRTSFIEQQLAGKVPVVRAMPNTPALVGSGMTAVAPGRRATARDLSLAERLLGSVGEVVEVSERQMDAVTALSGSGPAYFFYLMEQMIEAGARLGLPSRLARRLVVQTALGAACLVSETGEEPNRLRAKVTSKGGTTEAALRLFARKKVGQGLRQGIQAAAKRAKAITGQLANRPTG